MPSAVLDMVIVLNDFCHVQGGASQVAIDEAVALAASGIDVTFLGAVGPVSDALQDARLHVFASTNRNSPMWCVIRARHCAACGIVQQATALRDLLIAHSIHDGASCICMVTPRR